MLHRNIASGVGFHPRRHFDFGFDSRSWRRNPISFWFWFV